ncbi:MAG: FG-GAP-like repeat-containing protein [Bacteroidota bacterium]
MRSIRFSLILLCFLFIRSFADAQPFFQWNDSIRVKIDGAYVANPWAGGLNFIQASNIDLNSDGIKDLFIFDRTGNKVRTFINKGTANTVDFKYAPQYETKFPKLHDWALLADYNCDGKEDIFSYSDVGGGFKVYKNTSSISSGLEFTLVTMLQYSVFNPPGGSLINLYVSSVDIPAITDIDNDGDLDIVTFAITGTYMEYHQNKSMELYGTCDSLKFEMKNRCWGYAAENSFSNGYTLADTCFGNVSNPGIIASNDDDERSADRHSGSCLLCLDLDGDNDKDLVTGDISFNNLTMLTNGGTPTASNMVAIDAAFPANNSSTAPVDLSIFPCGYYADVNFDGVKDLLVSPNAPNASENFNSVVYYKNAGTNSFPDFQFQQSNLLQDNMIDVGEGAYPVFFDYDNDGLKDLFIGDYGYFGTTGFTHKIAQFKNTGTASLPEFDLITRDYEGMSTLGITNMVPAFGDLDGDADADMVVGGYDGKLHYFQNIASPGATANFVLSQPNLRNSSNRTIDVGDFAVPQIVDMDADGKNDLVIGGRNGKLAYYHHIGSATATLPLLDSVTHFFGNVKVNLPGYVTGYSYPFVFKQNGITKLLVGEESGFIRLYDNIDGNLSGAFSLVDSTYEDIFQGTRTAPNGADINNDGFMDLVVGNYEGGVSYYKGQSTPSSITEPDNFIQWNFDLFPNPADNTVNIKIRNDNNSTYTLDLYTIMGQLISSQKIINNSIIINTQGLAQGIYICKVSELSAGGIKTAEQIKRIVIRH